MKTKIFLISIFILSIHFCFSQDLIVTETNDSLNCKITKTADDYVYFTVLPKQVTEIMIPVAKVKAIEYDYYTDYDYFPEYQNTNIIHMEPVNTTAYQSNTYTTTTTNTNPIKWFELNKELQKFRFGIGAGYNRLTSAFVSGTNQDYSKELRSGYHLSGNVDFFLFTHLGIGIKYSVFNTYHSEDSTVIPLNSAYYTYGAAEDKIYSHYIGPIINTRFTSENKRHNLLIGFSGGYMTYKNEKTRLTDNYTETGNTIGYAFDMGWDWILTKELAIGFNFGYTFGRLDKYVYDDGTTKETYEYSDGNYKSLSRYDLSVGLRFYK